MTDRVVRDQFDGVAPDYERNRLGRWYIAHGRFIADRLSDRRFNLAVDIGCGTGWLLRELVRRGVASRGIGLDLSQAMVEEAAARASGSDGRPLAFYQCDWPQTPAVVEQALRSEDIDLVVCASSLHYFANVDAALARCREVLSPGGTVAILERAPELSALTRLWGHVHARILRDGASFIDTAELLVCLRGAGFSDVGVEAVLKRYFWNGKAITSMALSTGRAPQAD